MVKELFGFALLLYTFTFTLLPSPVYANHCGNPQYEGPYAYRGPAQYYCDQGTNQIFQDLDNCDDPTADHHKFIQSCRVNEDCVADPTVYTGSRHAQCVPRTGGTTTSANNAAGLQQIEDVFKNVISAVVGLAFIACLILLIRAGFKYLTSGGEPKTIQAAHLTVTWALLGIVFMAITWLILQLIKNFTGIDVTIFDIRTLCGGGKWC